MICLQLEAAIQKSLRDQPDAFSKILPRRPSDGAPIVDWPGTARPSLHRSSLYRDRPATGRGRRECELTELAPSLESAPPLRRMRGRLGLGITIGEAGGRNCERSRVVFSPGPPSSAFPKTRERFHDALIDRPVGKRGPAEGWRGESASSQRAHLH